MMPLWITRGASYSSLIYTPPYSPAAFPKIRRILFLSRLFCLCGFIFCRSFFCLCCFLSCRVFCFCCFLSCRVFCLCSRVAGGFQCHHIRNVIFLSKFSYCSVVGQLLKICVDDLAELIVSFLEADGILFCVHIS